MKISAQAANGSLVGLSNFNLRSGVGYKACTEEIITLINKQGFNGKKVAKALNAHPYTVHHFSVESETSTLIKIKAIDGMKNVSIIQLVK